MQFSTLLLASAASLAAAQSVTHVTMIAATMTQYTTLYLSGTPSPSAPIDSSVYSSIDTAVGSSAGTGVPISRNATFSIATLQPTVSTATDAAVATTGSPATTGISAAGAAQNAAKLGSVAVGILGLAALL